MNIILRKWHTVLVFAKIRLAKFLAAPTRIFRTMSVFTFQDDLKISYAAIDQGSLEDEGFSILEIDAEKIKNLLSAWKEISTLNSSGQVVDSRSTGKEFFTEMLNDADFKKYTALTSVALDSRVLKSVVSTMGMMPHLESIDILKSQSTGKNLTASQLWHYDVNDVRIVKLFIYLDDCDASNGPFTYICSSQSTKISKFVGHYVEDEVILKHAGPDSWRSIEGLAGTSFLIDTGRCYHFGSRSKRQRVAYIATYSSGLKFMPRGKKWVKLLDTYSLSKFQKKICGITA